jgi:hypothetical protein
MELHEAHPNSARELDVDFLVAHPTPSVAIRRRAIVGAHEELALATE